MVAALWSDRSAQRLLTGDVLVYRILLLAGVILSLPLTARHVGAARMWHVGYTGAYFLAAVTLAGIVFAWWARIHLGRLWSSAVTRKEDHRIVDTGPYRLVRHPIYTGLLVAALATASAQATAPAVGGWILMVLGLWRKARAEEHFLAAELEPEAYAAYRRRVPMLLPYVLSLRLWLWLWRSFEEGRKIAVLGRKKIGQCSR
jgi:protein-S-isoprenylcysteine O-methyltransferase Ste14